MLVAVTEGFCEYTVPIRTGVEMISGTTTDVTRVGATGALGRSRRVIVDVTGAVAITAS